MVTSKFTRDVFIYAPSMIFVILGFILFSFRGINKEEVTIGIICILGLFLAFILLGLNFLKYIRIIKVEKKILTYYSLLCPFGKTISFKDYIGKITVTETGSAGSYEVIYLVNKQNKTAFKLMGLHYKNFDEIKKAIALPEIKKNLSAKEYFQLLFTGVIDLSKVQNKKSAEFNINKFLGIFIAIALIVFVIGMLIKMITKFIR